MSRLTLPGDGGGRPRRPQTAPPVASTLAVLLDHAPRLTRPPRRLAQLHAPNTGATTGANKLTLTPSIGEFSVTGGVRSVLQVDWHRSDSVGSIPTAVKRSLWYTHGQDVPPSRGSSPSHLQLPADGLSRFLQKRGSANSLVEAVSEKPNQSGEL